MIRDVLASLAVPLIETPGYEADDVIATLATEAAERKTETVIVTGDRDSFQLVRDPYIRVLYNKRGVTDYSFYDEAGIFERCGVPPSQYVLLAALRGDPSDNLPGIPGVGEKTAAKLLTTYGDLDGIYGHLSELTPKLRENLTYNEPLARSNARIIPLVTDVPLDVDVADLTLGGWDLATAEATFTRYEMKTVWQRLEELMAAGFLGEPAEGSARPGGAAAVAVGARFGAAGAGASGDVADDAVPGLAPGEVVVPTTAGEVGEGPRCAREGAQGAGRPLDREPGPQRARRPGAGGSRGRARGRRRLRPRRGPALGVGGEEAQLGPVPTRGGPRGQGGHALLAPARHRRDRPRDGHGGRGLPARRLDRRVRVATAPGTDGPTHLGHRGAGRGAARRGARGGGGSVRRGGDGRRVPSAHPARGHGPAARRHRDPARPRAGQDGGRRHRHRPHRAPRDRRLAQGVRGHPAGGGPGAGRARVQRQLDAAAAHGPLRRTRAHSGKKTKTGFSTDARTLESLRGAHPIIDALLSYREVEKLRSTYGESLLGEVQSDGRIHASFGQTVARTGRISSDRPNLHNIPVRSEIGKQFRRAFVPAEGTTFLVADYDQVELRVIAHLSGDPGLIDAMTSGADVHRTVAAAVYGESPDEVTHTQREFCKMVSYGLAYGMEAYGLSQRLGVAVEEAAAIIESYFGAFPRVKRYMDETVAEAKIRGATRTMFGRIRPLPDLHASNYRLRQAAERQAMNVGIQGLAADIFKIALVRLDQDLETQGLTQSARAPGARRGDRRGRRAGRSQTCAASPSPPSPGRPTSTSPSPSPWRQGRAGRRRRRDGRASGGRGGRAVGGEGLTGGRAAMSGG